MQQDELLFFFNFIFWCKNKSFLYARCLVLSFLPPSSLFCWLPLSPINGSVSGKVCGKFGNAQLPNLGASAERRRCFVDLGAPFLCVSLGVIFWNGQLLDLCVPWIMVLILTAPQFVCIYLDWRFVSKTQNLSKQSINACTAQKYFQKFGSQGSALSAYTPDEVLSPLPFRTSSILSSSITTRLALPICPSLGGRLAWEPPKKVLVSCRRQLKESWLTSFSPPKWAIFSSLYGSISDIAPPKNGNQAARRKREREEKKKKEISRKTERVCRVGGTKEGLRRPCSGTGNPGLVSRWPGLLSLPCRRWRRPCLVSVFAELWRGPGTPAPT